MLRNFNNGLRNPFVLGVFILTLYGTYNHRVHQEVSELLAFNNACASVYLDGALEFFADLPKFTQAIITYKDNRPMVTISSDAIK